MANGRMVSTSFWKDSYIAELEPAEKLLFIYCLTNDRTSLAGIYEITLREIEFDTGLDRVFIQTTLAKFCDDQKMFYEKHWLVLYNFAKHQRQNPSIILGIENAVNALPKWLQEKISLEYEDKKVSILFRGQQQLGLKLPQAATIEAKETKEKLIEVKEIKLNLKASTAGKPPALNDEISKLYYKVMKQYSLPARNHNNVHAAIAKMKREAAEPALIKYLKFLLEKYQHIEFKHKPDLSEALDIYAKRMQIMNALKREFKASSSGVATI